MSAIHDVDTITKTTVKKKVPKRWKVILHNDDFTSMEFVVYMLMTIFHKTTTDATVLMLQVHEQGKAVAGVYTKEIAVTKTEEAMMLAEQNNFPLELTIEEE